MARSPFIVLEGADATGGTTASKGLVKYLNEHGTEAVWTKEPSDGLIGRYIKKILRGEELMDEAGMLSLFLADRWDHICNFIRPHLEQGEVVVCDRYYVSTWVYQQDSYPPEIIECLHSKILPPDYVFILTCPPEIVAERLRQREVQERYDDTEKQLKYAKLYSDFSRPSFAMRGGGRAPVEAGKIIPTVGVEKVFHISTANVTPPEVVADMLRMMKI